MVVFGKRLALKNVLFLMCILIETGIHAVSQEGNVWISSFSEIANTSYRRTRQFEFSSRLKRAASTVKNGYTFDEKVDMVRKHNEKRSLAKATEMLHITWHSDLEAFAQEWADGCRFEHSDTFNQWTEWDVVGESLYAGGGNYNPDRAFNAFYNEINNYDYDTNTCTSVCGHYKAVVSDRSQYIGCGVNFCPTISPIGFTDAYLFVCNYGPVGRTSSSSRPYTYIDDQAICSNCPIELPICENNLCRSADCYGLTCLNNGIYLDDVCMCDCRGTGYTGTSCEISENPVTGTEATVTETTTPVTDGFLTGQYVTYYFSMIIYFDNSPLFSDKETTYDCSSLFSNHVPLSNIDLLSI